MRLAAVLAVIALPSLAAARPITAGVSAGVLHDKVDQDGEGNRTLGLFGRVGFSKRISGQLEVMKIDTDDQYWEPTTIRVATALLVVDLVDKGRWIPTLKAGAGIDRASTEWDTEEGHHYEGGLGIEYRAEGGLTLGFEFRIGGRSVDEPEYEIQATEGDIAPHIYDGNGLREGEYRAARFTLGIAF